jgi:hypothetical protein
MMENMDRRRFLTFAASGVALGAALVVLQGCSSGSSNSDSTPTTPTTPTNPTFSDKNGAVSANHGHTFTLTAAQQQAGADVTITSKGATHAHKLFLTAAEVAAVVAGTKVAKESSTVLAHSHIVTFNP